MSEPTVRSGWATSRPAETPGDRLSALLKSAVDDQVAEQRQLSKLLAEVREALNRRNEDDAATIQDVHDGLAGLRTELRVVPETVAPAVASSVGAAVADLGRTLERLEENQEATGRDLAAAITALHDRVESLEAMPASIAALTAQIENVSAGQHELALSGPQQHQLAANEIANIVRAGVRDATRDFVRDYLRDAVRDIVTVSTRDTERRITDHVDEAILALAQALLPRRAQFAPDRPVIVASPRRPSEQQPPQPAAAVEPDAEPVAEPAAAAPAQLDSAAPSPPAAAPHARDADSEAVDIETVDIETVDVDAVDGAALEPAAAALAADDPPVEEAPVEAPGAATGEHGHAGAAAPESVTEGPEPSATQPADSGPAINGSPVYAPWGGSAAGASSETRDTTILDEQDPLGLGDLVARSAAARAGGATAPAPAAVSRPAEPDAGPVAQAAADEPVEEPQPKRRWGLFRRS